VARISSLFENLIARLGDDHKVFYSGRLQSHLQMDNYQKRARDKQPILFCRNLSYKEKLTITLSRNS
jgi:hypothetical protein